LFQGRHAAYTALLTLGIGVHAGGLFIVSTILPTVVADIGGTAFYAWTIMLYTVASIIGTASGGVIRARLALRAGYLLGTLVVVVGLLGCALAPAMTVLLCARTIQGLGSGVLIALAYSMVSDLYPEPLRPRIFSAIAGVWGLAALVGPLVGGVFANHGWWRGAFWVFIPVLALLGGLAWLVLPANSAEVTDKRFPFLRLLLLGAGVLCVALSGQVASLGLRLGLIAGAILLVGLTFRLDAQAPVRLFPPQPLSVSTPVGTAYWIFFLFGITRTQLTVYLPLIVQVLYHLSPLAAGYFAALLSGAWTILALCTAGFQEQRARRTIVFGALLIIGGAAGMTVLILQGPLLLLGICVALTGAGIGSCFAHISSHTIAAAQPGQGALTASAIPTMQLLGIAFGAALTGCLANAAGLSQGISVTTVSTAAQWVYQVSLLAPIVLSILAWRLVRLPVPVSVVSQ
jgi:MFS family permease